MGTSESKTPLSVVIPAYSVCPHLPALLSALVEQKAETDEILLVYSCCPDGYHVDSSSIRLILHTERLLPGAARNRGAENARTQALVFLDADVLPSANYLEKVRAEFHAGTRAV